MAAPFTVKIGSKTPKKPVKGLPSSVEITEKTTVQDIKIQVAKPGGWDPERMGLFDAQTKKQLKSPKQLVLSNEDVVSSKEILVKDFGPQLSWTAVYVIEYLGPLLIHLIVPLLRRYIYSTYKPLSSSQYLALAMIVLHFIKREYETLYVHKFSMATMPAVYIFRNSAHYWILAGANIAYWIYAPTSITAKSSPLINYINIAGVVLYIFGQVSNYITHKTLANLRPPGSTARVIPRGYGFGLVTCPNYLFELIAWTGIGLVSKSLSVHLFNGVAWWIMNQWAIKKEKALRNAFPDKYKKKKYPLVPSPATVFRALTR